MHVAFLEIDTESQWAVASLGPAFLAAQIRAKGHRASFHRIPVHASPVEVVSPLAEDRPNLIGVSLTTRQWLRARALIEIIRQHLDVPVVAGGLHPTFSPEVVLAAPGFDYVCLGEGEVAILDLVDAVQAGHDPAEVRIDNIWGRGGPRPPIRPPFEPLDTLPFIARDFLDERHGVVHMATQRGCPFKCTYCAARMYNELYQPVGEYGRRRSVANVLAEVESIREQGPLNYIIFLDDTFTINHPWVAEFGRAYRQAAGPGFSLHARVETVNEKILGQLAEAGCRHITYGVESGSERIRRDLMRRPVTNRRFIDVFRWTKAAGILATANYMMGLPTETPSEMEETLELHDQLDPDDFGFFVFYPYPGTHLHRYCLDHGFLAPDHLDHPAHHRTSVLTLPTLTQDEIAATYQRWVDVRARHALRRSGTLSQPDQDQVVADIVHCASVG